ncbi:ArnT family glycosyltransferase [Anabaenopsis elenkinii]|jgi:hypothetical protein|uniref:Glycosyltransferase family 39 protein n=1 Tax=Anabaenopsis elenkinii CCIBt3563 TaxID=2779889 RepID=A0A7S6RGY8_9CYAN|nr:glycosyltransferase family 39 protein [Anabaenopsis elenkinii]QOV23352.1 glycosyltransferase family 39 protein [Anabaenopsis elenkinii CCIBt3563]
MRNLFNSRSRLPIIIILFISLPLFFSRGIGVFDDSVYLKIGELITHGILPYRDVFDNKPPGIYYLGALLAWIGNYHWLTSRIFLFIIALCFSLIVHQYTKKLWGHQAGYLVAIIFPTSYVISQGYSFHTEQFCGLFGFLSIILVSDKRKNQVINWFLAGIFINIAFLFKQVGIIYLVAFLLCDILFILFQKVRFVIAVKRLLFLCLGFCLSTLIVFGLIFINGYWQSFYEDVFIGVLPFADNHLNIYNVINLWLKTPVSLLLALIFIPLFNKKILTRVIYSNHLYEFILLFSMGFLSILPTLKINSNTHYLGTSVFGLAIAESILLSYLFDDEPAINKNIKSGLDEINISKNHKNTKLYLITILLIPYILAILWVSKTIIQQNRIYYDLQQMSEIRKILNKYTPPQTQILVLSDLAPRIYYMSGRLPYTRYIYYYFNTKIQIAEALKILETENVPTGIIELGSHSLIDGLSEQKLLDLQEKYLTIEVSTPNSPHLHQTKKIVLISRKFVQENY